MCGYFDVYILLPHLNTVHHYVSFGDIHHSPQIEVSYYMGLLTFRNISQRVGEY